MSKLPSLISSTTGVQQLPGPVTVDAVPISHATAPPQGHAMPSTVGGGSHTIQKQSIWVAALVLLLVIGGIVWAITWGPFSANAGLQSQMDQVLENDS